MMYLQTGPGKPCICRLLLYILRPPLINKKIPKRNSFARHIALHIAMAMMEGAGGYVDDEIDFVEEVAQPRTGKKDALGKDPGKATRSHMSSAKGHLNHYLKLSGAKYKDYSLIPKDKVEIFLCNSDLFGEFVNYLLTHEDLTLKPRQKKKMAMSSVTNNVSGNEVSCLGLNLDVKVTKQICLLQIVKIVT